MQGERNEEMHKNKWDSVTFTGSLVRNNIYVCVCLMRKKENVFNKRGEYNRP